MVGGNRRVEHGLASLAVLGLKLVELANEVWGNVQHVNLALRIGLRHASQPRT
jgi:hypothetical protein